MTNPSNARVIFFQVHDNASKLKRIVETAHSHFERKEALLILTEDDRSSAFVDELLWKMPETSFLPHIATDDPTTDWIAIAKIKKNINNAPIAFNLCPTPLLIEGPFRIIYEFEDLTSPNKKNLSSLRYDAYKRAGHLIEARL
jgi:DNA polymerase-3 subunit chi